MSLFEGPAHIELSQEPLAAGATTLRNFTVTEETEILSRFHDVVAGPRSTTRSRGFRMSIAMTNCRRSRLGDGQKPAIRDAYRAQHAFLTVF